FALAPTYPHWQFTGVDFIPEMVAHAREGRDQCPHPENLHFCQGNLLDLEANASLESGYELVFTDRCLINLNSHELQMQGVDQLRAKVSTGGYLVLIENIARTHDRQNELRQALGLEARIPDTFNLFLDESRFLDHVQGKLELIHRECFASLHDIILYVLVPMVNGGRVDYDHPMVGAVTQLLHSQKGELDHELAGAFGEFGQNCLYVFKKI
ncbi:MAG: class I SAM-dependent methyltransferase, partial [Desulfovibrionales bacterium]|nr:class I SAM-dependent methyltransferase [Desulfovibrionales bacterium]